MSTTHLVAAALIDPGSSLLAVPVPTGTGILDTLTTKNDEVKTLLRAFSSVAGILFVIINAIKSGGALGRIVVSGLCAGVFVWIVFNVTELKDRVNTEVTAAPVTVTTTAHLT